MPSPSTWRPNHPQFFKAIVPFKHRDSIDSLVESIHCAWLYHPNTGISNQISLKPSLEIAGIQPNFLIGLTGYGFCAFPTGNNRAFPPEAVGRRLESQGYAEWHSLSHWASDRFSKMLLENHINCRGSSTCVFS